MIKLLSTPCSKQKFLASSSRKVLKPHAFQQINGEGTSRLHVPSILRYLLYYLPRRWGGLDPNGLLPGVAGEGIVGEACDALCNIPG
jgi:hypothetical protein